MPTEFLLRNLQGLYSDVNSQLNGPIDIHIKDNVIVAIGENLPVSSEAEIVNVENCVAIPGLVNTHHHFYQTLTRAIPRMQNVELFPWLVDHYRVWEGLDEEAIYLGSLTAMGELLLTGCTLTTDHHYLFPKNATPALIDMQFEAAKKLGIRFIATRGSMSVSKSKGGLPPDSVVQDEETIIKDSQRVIEKFHDPSDFSMNRVALAPCSPFSVSEASMRESLALARSYKVRVHTHLAETLDEEHYCIKRFGCRPVQLMKRMGWIGDDVWFAHCVHLNADEVKLFADTGTGVAHCPSSNMRLGSGIAPISELLRLGGQIGLAVDGSASNDSSDMLGEVRQAMLLQRVLKGAEALTAGEAFHIATAGGAKILGFDKCGVLKPGYLADIAVFRIDGLEFTGTHDPILGLVFAGNNHHAEYVFVNGKPMVQKGRLMGMPAAEIRTRAHTAAQTLVKSACNRTSLNYFSSERN